MICASLFLISSCLQVENDKVSKSRQSQVVEMVIPHRPKITKSDIKEVIESVEPDWSGNEQNSGIIDFNKSQGWQITPKALSKYNFLVKKYGQDMQPPIKQNDGVTVVDNKIFISQEYMIKFAFMNMKNKNYDK
jgi:hypothetical protein